VVDVIGLDAQMMDAASIIARLPPLASVVPATVASATVVSREKRNGGKDVVATHERRYTPRQISINRSFKRAYWSICEVVRANHHLSCSQQRFLSVQKSLFRATGAFIPLPARLPRCTTYAL